MHVMHFIFSGPLTFHGLCFKAVHQCGQRNVWSMKGRWEGCMKGRKVQDKREQEKKTSEGGRRNQKNRQKDKKSKRDTKGGHGDRYPGARERGERELAAFWYNKGQKHTTAKQKPSCRLRGGWVRGEERRQHGREGGERMRRIDVWEWDRQQSVGVLGMCWQGSTLTRGQAE